METPKSRSRNRTTHVPTPKMTARKKTLFSTATNESESIILAPRANIEMNILDGMMPLDFESALHVQSRLKSCLRPRVKKIPEKFTTILKIGERIPLSVLSDSNSAPKKAHSPRSKKVTKLAENETSPRENQNRVLRTPSPKSRRDNSASDDLGNLLKDTLNLRSHKGSKSIHNSNDESDSEGAETALSVPHKRTHKKSAPSKNSNSPKSKQPRIEQPLPVTPKTSTKPQDPNSNTDSPSTNKNYVRSIEEFSISTKSFYSSRNKSPTPPRSTRPRLSLPIINLNKSPQLSVKRSRPKARHDMRLAKNVSHGIRRTKFKPTQQTIEAILQSLKGDKFKKLLEKRQYEKKADAVQKILKANTSSFKKSRPLDVNRTNSDDELFSGSEDENQENKEMMMENTGERSASTVNVPAASDSEEESEEEPVKPRKFFKSRTKSVQNAFTINNVRGTVKKGRVSLLASPAWRKTRKSNGPPKTKLDFANEQAAVKDIIDWLDHDPTTSNHQATTVETDASGTIQDDEYQEFRRKIPYKTNDPAMVEQQQLLLDFLISYDICNERNFEIFIMDPDNHKDEAAKIVDSLITVKPAKEPDTLSTSRDDEDILSEMSEPLGLNFTDSQEANNFRQRLPYNTSDPVVAEQQKTLLEFLIKNQICNEENFQIFIAEPEKHRDKTSKILQNYMVTSLDVQNEPKTVLESGEDNCMSIDPFSVAAELPSSYVADTTFETSHTTLESMISDDDDTQWRQLSPIIPMQHQQPILRDYDNVEDAENRSNNLNDPKLFPIFYSGKVKPLTARSTRKKSPKCFTGGFGTNQYQIDAGQKAFGAQQCHECGLVFTVHEPEEEKLHSIYHRSLNILKFKGWIDEDIVMSMPEWGQGGRIIRLQQNIHPKRLERVADILNIIDKELGIVSDVIPTPFVAYLAIRRNEIVGFSLVQPIKLANRYICLNEADYITEEAYDAKCGISRIWVSPLNRRQRIATKLIEAIRRFTYPGIELSTNELAFSSPTEDGKIFAQKIAKRIDFLVYESF